MPPSVSVVVVAYGEPLAAQRTVASVLAQTLAPIEVLVVDNHADGATADALEAAGRAAVRVLRCPGNIGYCRACEFAARHAVGDWLFFLNPDADAEPTCLERLLDAVEPGVGVLGAQVLLPDGATVNAGDNPVHVTGISWAGGYGRPREDGPPREVACVSGAALAIRSELFAALGGHCPAFVMYHDDVDLCWRARLAGMAVRYVPRAAVRHAYEFDKGPRKWLMLEHNRAWTVLAVYRLRTLVLLAPLLVATEVAIAMQARRSGWWASKRLAWRALTGELADLRRWRREVQARRTVPDAEVVAGLASAIDSPFLAGPLLDHANPWMERYMQVVRWLLRA